MTTKTLTLRTHGHPGYLTGPRAALLIPALAAAAAPFGSLDGGRDEALVRLWAEATDELMTTGVGPTFAAMVSAMAAADEYGGPTIALRGSCLGIITPTSGTRIDVLWDAGEVCIHLTDPSPEGGREFEIRAAAKRLGVTVEG